MSLRQWLFDNPPSGTTLTTGNVFSEDNAVPQQVTASGGSIQSSDVQVHAGTTSARFVRSSPGCVIRLPLVAASQQLAVSMYVFRPAYTVNEGFLAVRHSSGPVAHVQATSTGALVILLPSEGGSVTGTAGDIPANTWVRVEVVTDTAAATMTATSYLGDSLTPIGTLTHSALLSTAAMTHIDIGLPSGSSNALTQYIDSVQTNDGSTTEIGPYIPPAPPETNAYIRVNGEWVPADPYVRTGGSWVLADSVPL